MATPAANLERHTWHAKIYVKMLRIPYLILLIVTSPFRKADLLGTLKNTYLMNDATSNHETPKLKALCLMKTITAF